MPYIFGIRKPRLESILTVTENVIFGKLSDGGILQFFPLRTRGCNVQHCLLRDAAYIRPSPRGSYKVGRLISGVVGTGPTSWLYSHSSSMGNL